MAEFNTGGTADSSNAGAMIGGTMSSSMYKNGGNMRDNNLANNYPPYDKITRGDVIAGRLGKDQMGGKHKMAEGGLVRGDVFVVTQKDHQATGDFFTFISSDKNGIKAKQYPNSYGNNRILTIQGLNNGEYRKATKEELTKIAKRRVIGNIANRQSGMNYMAKGGGVGELYNKMLDEVEELNESYREQGLSIRKSLDEAHKIIEKKYPKHYKGFNDWLNKGSAYDFAGGGEVYLEDKMAKGGGVGKMAMSYKLNSDDKHNIDAMYFSNKDKMSIGELKQYISDKLKINYFEISSYMNRNNMMAKGGGVGESTYKTEQPTLDFNNSTFQNYLKKNKIKASYKSFEGNAEVYNYLGSKQALKDMLIKYWYMDESKSDASELAENDIEKYAKGGNIKTKTKTKTTMDKKWSKKIDKAIRAKKPGFRKTPNGGYYEYRSNRSDKNPKMKLEWGGTAESSETGEFIGGENSSSMYSNGGGISTFTYDIGGL